MQADTKYHHTDLAASAIKPVFKPALMDVMIQG